MITAADVQRVARTAKPHRITPKLSITIDDIIRLTIAQDWDGHLYQLHLRPAEEIATQYNLLAAELPAVTATPNLTKSNGKRKLPGRR